jgi:hypothetical protein
VEELQGRLTSAEFTFWAAELKLRGWEREEAEKKAKKGRKR